MSLDGFNQRLACNEELVFLPMPHQHSALSPLEESMRSHLCVLSFLFAMACSGAEHEGTLDIQLNNKFFQETAFTISISTDGGKTENIVFNDEKVGAGQTVTKAGAIQIPSDGKVWFFVTEAPPTLSTPITLRPFYLQVDNGKNVVIDFQYDDQNDVYLMTPNYEIQL